MKVQVDTVLRDMDDKDIFEKVPSGQQNLMGQDILVDGQPLTLSKVAVNALVGSYQDEQGISGDEKVKRWQLAMKIRGQEEIDLAAEDIALIKKLIGKAYGPVIVGQAFLLLEAKTIQ